MSYQTTVCKDCDYKGMPLIFYTENEYKQYLKGLLKEVQYRLKTKLNNDEKSDVDLDNNIKSNSEDKVLLKTIKKLIDQESKDTKSIDLNAKPGWHKNRSWWIEISIAFIISGLLLIFNISFIMIFDYSNLGAGYTFYMIIEFFLQGILFLAIIVVLEYFILFKFLK